MYQAFSRFYESLRNLLSAEEGQDLVEYALLCTLIALTLISSLNSFATTLVQFFTNVSTSLG
jgi:Flp pilus assembly pilin Flp